MNTNPPQDPGNGASSSGNGGNNNDGVIAAMIEAIRTRAASISDEVRKAALALPLAAFIQVVGVAKTAWGRKKRSQATADGEMSKLRTVARNCPAYNSVAIDSLTPALIKQMANELDTAINPVTGQVYKTTSYNSFIGALSRQLETLTSPPLLLIPDAKSDAMRKMIVFGDPCQVSNCTLPTAEQEKVLIQYVQGSCGRGARLKSLIAFLLCLFYGVRRGMINMIMPADLNIERNTLQLQFNKQRGGRPIVLEVEMPIPLRDAFVDWIAFKAPAPGRPLVSIKSISKLLHAASAAAGIPAISHRTLRKLFITRCAEAGVDVQVVMAIVGHKDGGKSIKDHYLQYRRNFINGSLRIVNAGYMEDGAPEQLSAQEVKARELIEMILAGSLELRVRCLEYMELLADACRAHNVERIQELTSLVGNHLPTLSEAHPAMPRATALSEAMTVAANVRNQCWKLGVGYNEVAESLNLSRSVMYDVLKGTRQTEQVLAALARYFGTTVQALRDPAASRYDVQRVLNNVDHVAKLFGVSALPCPETVTNVLAQRHLPPGNVLKRLADAVGMPLEEFLTQDMSQRTLVLKPTWRKPVPLPVINEMEQAKRANFAANLKLRLLIGGLSACEGGKRVGITRTMMMNYAGGRSFPPKPVLEKIAAFFDTTTDDLTAPVPELDAAEIGRRITALVEKRGYTLKTQAWKLRVGSEGFVAVANGEQLPNGWQLARIAKYFGVTPQSILGAILPGTKVAADPAPQIQLPANGNEERREAA